MPVAVKGAVALRKALREFSPDLSKELPKEMAAALKPVVKSAKGFLPSDSSVLSNWKPRENSNGTFPTYNASLVKRGVGYKTSPSKADRRGFRSLARLFNKTAAGAIYETAGRINPNSIFVKNMNSKYSSSIKGSKEMQGRALYRAYEENNGKAQDGVLRAIEKAKYNLNRRAKVSR